MRVRYLPRQKQKKIVCKIADFVASITIMTSTIKVMMYWRCCCSLSLLLLLMLLLLYTMIIVIVTVIIENKDKITHTNPFALVVQSIVMHLPKVCSP